MLNNHTTKIQSAKSQIKDILQQNDPVSSNNKLKEKKKR
jgi:hypothetical protein